MALKSSPKSVSCLCCANDRGRLENGLWMIALMGRRRSATPAMALRCARFAMVVVAGYATKPASVTATGNVSDPSNRPRSTRIRPPDEGRFAGGVLRLVDVGRDGVVVRPRGLERVGGRVMAVASSDEPPILRLEPLDGCGQVNIHSGATVAPLRLDGPATILLARGDGVWARDRMYASVRSGVFRLAVYDRMAPVLATIVGGEDVGRGTRVVRWLSSAATARAAVPPWGLRGKQSRCGARRRRPRFDKSA